MKTLSIPLQRFGALEELGPALGLPFASSTKGERKETTSESAKFTSLTGARGASGGIVLRRTSSGTGGRVLLHPGKEEFAKVCQCVFALCLIGRSLGWSVSCFFSS